MILFFLASYDTVIATEIDHNPTKEEIEKLSWLYGNAKLINDKQLSGYYLSTSRNDNPMEYECR